MLRAAGEGWERCEIFCSTDAGTLGMVAVHPVHHFLDLENGLHSEPGGSTEAVFSSIFNSRLFGGGLS